MIKLKRKHNSWLPIFCILTAVLIFFTACPGTTPPDATIDSEYITSPTTWKSGNLYFVKNYVEIQSVLTIEPGAIVAFDVDAYMAVEAGAQLNAIGTDSKPITFTSAKDDFADFTITGITGTAASGDWRGIYIAGASSTLQYCNIYYALTAVEVTAEHVTFQNNCIAHNKTGLDASAPATFTVGNNRFYSNDHPFYGSTKYSIDNTNVFQNADASLKNTIQGIEVYSGYVSANITWNCTTVAYIIDTYIEIQSSGVLNLGTGTVLKFRAGAYLSIDAGGTLNNEENAFFTSIKDDTHLGDSNGDGSASTPAASDWGYIYDTDSDTYLAGSNITYETP